MDLNDTVKIQDDIYLEIDQFDKGLKYYVNVNPDYFSAESCTEEFLELISRIEEDENRDNDHWGHLAKVLIENLDDAQLGGNFVTWLWETLFDFFLPRKGEDKVVISAIMKLLNNRKFKSQGVKSMLENHIRAC